MTLNNALADLVVAIHFAYVAFVVLGLIAILVGVLFHWEWIRNKWFRLIHLSMIGIVVVESLAGITCPLTTLEDYLRTQGGGAGREGSFVGHWLHELMFFDLAPGTFRLIYCTFGAVVLLTLVMVRIRWTHRAP